MNEGLNDKRHGPASMEGTHSIMCSCVLHMYVQELNYAYECVYVGNLGGPAGYVGSGVAVNRTQLLTPAQAPHPTLPNPCQ